MARSGWARSLAGATLLTLAGATGAFAQVCPLPAWTAGPVVGTDMYSPAVTSCNGLTYEAGGYSFSAAGNVNQFKSYNPVTNAWTTLANLPTATAISSLGCDAAGGRLFLFGGNTDPSTVTNIVQVYTIATNTWAPGPPLPAQRSFMASGAIGGKIYLVAGYSTGNVDPAFDTNWEFDPVTLTYTVRAPLPAMLGGAAGAVSGGRLYVMGGRNLAATQLNTVYEYNPVTNTWATKAPMPTAVNVAGGTGLGGNAACNGDVIVVGGGNPFEPNGPAFPVSGTRAIETTAVTQLYDVTANAWTAGPNLLGPRSFTTAVQSGDTLLVIGGYTGTTTTAAVDRIAGPPLPVDLSGFTIQ